MWTFLTKDAWTREIKVKPWNRAYKDFEIEEEERRAARAADPLPPE
jgi:predicted GIY-YIG superfamily endonuclease